MGVERQLYPLKKSLNMGGIFMVTVVRPDLSQAIESERLICVDTARNSNKQWRGWVMPSGELYVEYGRVGYSQKPHIYPCGSVRAAQVKLTRLVNEKLAKGYQPVNVEDMPVGELDFSQLEPSEAIAIRRRLEQLQQQGRRIAQCTGVSFDVNRGVFMTQMGVISLPMIEQGMRVLQRVQEGLERWQNHPRNWSVFTAAVEEYLSIIPMNVGMTLDPLKLLGYPQQVQGQGQALEELRSALAEVKEIQAAIRDAFQGDDQGSDERARWLHWGEDRSAETAQSIVESGGDRAAWSRWGEEC
jgi:predicted DNA-binding WGR domain protein